MPNLKQLRKRIRSVSNTQQITKAMKMVAAAKLRRSQERAVSARAYSKLMERMVHALANQVAKDEGSHPLLAGHGNEGKQVELVICTADRGLCGSFNSSVIRSTRQKIAELRQAGFTVTITCVGRKGADVLKRQFSDSIRRTHPYMNRKLRFEVVEQEIAKVLINDYNENKFDICLLVYNTFKSAMSQAVTWKQIMPVPIAAPNVGDESDRFYLFEPSPEELQEEILPRNVAVQLYQALVESDASEHGARMTAMDNAVRNAKEMNRKLTISYNRIRQAVITKELLEIIGGAESLKG